MENNKTIIPPIKSNGIKTKLIPWINSVIELSGVDLNTANWVEPFFGTGVVGINSIVSNGKHIIGDGNPHIINFYKALQDKSITPEIVRNYLEDASPKLASAGNEGYDYYREVRTRFNKNHEPLDFLFLSRSCFNGLMRFNRYGEYNVPFCKNPNRFTPAYITKICNIVKNTQDVILNGNWEFNNQDFTETIKRAKAGDIIYCDPPYFGLSADYFNGWTAENEETLYNALKNTKAKFIMSTWARTDYKQNEMIDKFWKEFNIIEKEHFYFIGSHEEYRHSVIEVLITNFDIENK